MPAALKRQIHMHNKANFTDEVYLLPGKRTSLSYIKNSITSARLTEFCERFNLHIFITVW